jgi:hypothetical protein
MFKSRRWDRHVAQMREKRNAYKTSVRNPEREHMEDLGVDGRIILK